MTDRLFSHELHTASAAQGPLLFLERAGHLAYRELVEVELDDGVVRRGQVLEVDRDLAVIEVFEGTRGIALDRVVVRARGEVAGLDVGEELCGRVLDPLGVPLDGLPPPLCAERRDVHGTALNPVARAHPSDFIETGISAIDGLNTLVRGQKLPIFSGFGLPAGELAARIAAHAQVPGAERDSFLVVFAALGITRREADALVDKLRASGALGRAVLFLNLADGPAAERLLAPRAALTAAEYLAFEAGHHVLVLLTDMTHYCEALREVSTAREELPGRRGYPGYLYTDLAQLFERAGRVQGREGSVTQLPILSMPSDDITHPIPDLTGYITEGQVVLSRDLHRRGIEPPIDVLASLSRLMNAGTGAGRTRADHRPLADQLFALYAGGCDLRRLVAVIGEAALSKADRRQLEFADAFEKRLVSQGDVRRTLDETLDLAWDLLAPFPPEELKRIPTALLDERRAPAAPETDDVKPKTGGGA